MYVDEIIKVPEGVEVSIENNKVKVKGEKGELEREFYHPNIKIVKEDNKVIVRSWAPKRKIKRIMKTWVSHIKNMIYGVINGYKYKLKIVYTHFPMNVKLEGNKLIIQNFMGEKSNRIAKILDGVKVNIKGDEIIVEGIDIEKTGQTAGNIERAAKIRRRVDRRIFQDGIYIIEKPKREGL